MTLDHDELTFIMSVHHVSSSCQFIIMSLSNASSAKLSSSRQFIISVHHHVTLNRELD